MMFWKKEPEVLAALEIGTRKIAVAIGILREDGSLEIPTVGESPSAGVRKGEIVDFTQAQQAVRDAIAKAESSSNVTVGEVYLALTGAHFDSKNIRVRVATDEEDPLVTLDRIRELDELPWQTQVPADHDIIHALPQFYHLDNGSRTTEPVGLSSRWVEGTYHVVSGIRTRLETQVRCVVDLGVEVSCVTLASYASAQVVMDAQDKELGSVVIDLGAGITDYLVYKNGAVVHSGTIGVGGDHLTQDVALGLKLPFQRAEDLKVKHGTLHAGKGGADTILLPRDATAEERTIHAESLRLILHARQQEILELIRADIDAAGLWPQLAGRVFLTGGASRLPGLAALAGRVFPVPSVLMNEFNIEGDQSYSRRPDLSTVMGLLMYAQRVGQGTRRPTGLARLGRSLRDLISAMNLF